MADTYIIGCCSSVVNLRHWIASTSAQFLPLHSLHNCTFVYQMKFRDEVAKRDEEFVSVCISSLLSLCG
jgi:hypothetical protein